jgi:hypothetical protein
MRPSRTTILRPTPRRSIAPEVVTGLADLRTTPDAPMTASHRTGPRELLGGDSSPQPLRFPANGHLLWAGLCPRLHESAVKRFSTRTRPRMPWLKTAFVQAAWAAGRKRNTYFADLPLLRPSIRGDSGAR